jgi:hypothetical protein
LVDVRKCHLLGFVLLLQIFAVPSLASADELRAEASVDRDVVGVGERLVLTIKVFGGGQVTEPDMADIEGFRVVNTSRSQTLSIVNFDAVRSLTLQYVLVAESEGEYAVGPFEVRSGDEVYETEPIKVTVIRGQGPPPGTQVPPGDDDAVLVRASVDKTRAYVGEQVTYNLQFAYRVRPRDVEYTPSDHTGFWTEEMGETGPSVETIDGKRYYVVNKRTAYFPISGGNFTIGQASVRYLVSDRRPFPFDPFDMSGGRQGRAVTEPIDIVVRPLPSEGKPADFAGAVGSFSLNVSPSSREVKAGESLTLSVRISGRGNMKSIGGIETPELEGFRVFAPKARESVNMEMSQVGGEKVFDLVLVPERPGEQTIEGFTFSYFDPRKEEYVTLVSNPISVTVLPGDETLASSVPGGSVDGAVAHKDIRHIKRVRIAQNSLTLSGGGLRAIMMSYAPILAVVVGLIVSLQRKRAAISGKGAAKKAYKSSMADLRTARKMATMDGVAGDASSLTTKALRSYLAARSGRSESLIDEHVVASLDGLNVDTRTDIAGLLGALDRTRFAPGGAGAAEVGGLIDRAESLMRTLNTEWKQ